MKKLLALCIMLLFSQGLKAQIYITNNRTCTILVYVIAHDNTSGSCGQYIATPIGIGYAPIAGPGFNWNDIPWDPNNTPPNFSNLVLDGFIINPDPFFSCWDPIRVGETGCGMNSSMSTTINCTPCGGTYTADYNQITSTSWKLDIY